MASILIIDDQKGPHENIKFLAGMDNMLVRTHHAYTGEEGLALWEQERLDIELIILDYQLSDGSDGRPVVWGDSVFRALRERGCDIPIAVVTGLDNAAPAFAGTDIVGIFKKPLGIPAFERLINTYASEAKGELPSSSEEESVNGVDGDGKEAPHEGAPTADGAPPSAG